jgi:hypothetical protein
MAVFIASRTSVQCRSQNQRLFRKYKNIRNIVASFKEEYGRDRFELDYRAACDFPAIKFRTEYEKYLEGQVKKLAETATQTDPPSVVAPLELETHLPLPWLPDSLSNSNPFYPNWLIIPFYS